MQTICFWQTQPQRQKRSIPVNILRGTIYSIYQMLMMPKKKLTIVHHKPGNVDHIDNEINRNTNISRDAYLLHGMYQWTFLPHLLKHNNLYLILILPQPL